MTARRSFLLGIAAAVAGVFSPRPAAPYVETEAARRYREWLTRAGDCDVCGEQAIQLQFDLVEETLPGEPYEHFCPTGDLHHRCVAHLRESVTYTPRDLPKTSSWWTKRDPQVIERMRSAGLIH